MRFLKRVNNNWRTITLYVLGRISTWVQHDDRQNVQLVIPFDKMSILQQYRLCEFLLLVSLHALLQTFTEKCYS